MEKDPKQTARDSYHGQRLTEAQLDKAYDLTGVLHRDLQRTGSFVEPLGDFSHAFARTEKLTTAQAEDVLRGIYQARHGETLNQNRERLLAREDQIRDNAEPDALNHARQIAPMISQGDGMPWYKAQDRAAVEFASKHGITERGAKEMMEHAFEKHEGQDLYAHCKALEHARSSDRDPERRTDPESAVQPRARTRRR